MHLNNSCITTTLQFHFYYPHYSIVTYYSYIRGNRSQLSRITTSEVINRSGFEPSTCSICSLALSRVKLHCLEFLTCSFLRSLAVHLGLPLVASLPPRQQTGLSRTRNSSQPQRIVSTRAPRDRLRAGQSHTTSLRHSMCVR